MPAVQLIVQHAPYYTHPTATTSKQAWQQHQLQAQRMQQTPVTNNPCLAMWRRLQSCMHTSLLAPSSPYAVVPAGYAGPQLLACMVHEE
jgi:hypothetical protein